MEAMPKHALSASRVIVRHDEIQDKLADLASRLNSDFAGKRVTCVIAGIDAVVFAGQLLPMLTFDLTTELMNVTYGPGKIDIDWAKLNTKAFADQFVLVLTGVYLDNGVADLLADRLIAVDKAKKVYRCALIDKYTETLAVVPEYYCLRLTFRDYYFGFGLAYLSSEFPEADGLFRNQIDIWAA